MEKGVPIRAISRSINVLQAINHHGSLSLMEIAREAGVPYPTACRIVQTFAHEGLIEREPARKRYRVTELALTLSLGYRDHGDLVSRARSHITALTKKIVWPVSLTTRVGSKMMVRDSTHAETSLTFSNYYPGYTLPILECASGIAYLAFLNEDERQGVIRGLNLGAQKSFTLSLVEHGKLLSDVRKCGYATRGRNPFTANPGMTSSIAVPVFQNEKVVGSVAIIFFSTAITMDEALSRYLDDLKSTAQNISVDLSQKANRRKETAPRAKKSAAA